MHAHAKMASHEQAGNSTVPAGGRWTDESVIASADRVGGSDAPSPSSSPSTTSSGGEDWQQVYSDDSGWTVQPSAPTTATTLPSANSKVDGPDAVGSNYYFNAAAATDLPRARSFTVQTHPEPLRGAHNQGDDDDGDENEPVGWEDDTFANHEVDTILTRAIKFTLVDHTNPDTIAQLSMDKDLGLYFGTRASRCRLDTVARGAPGALAVYGPNDGTTKGRVVSAGWAHIETDPETGRHALRVDGDIVARDVYVGKHGSVEHALDAWRTAASDLAERQNALEQRVALLTDALVKAEDQVQTLSALFAGTARIRVEHGPGSDPSAWLFRTGVGPDGSSTFSIENADSVLTRMAVRPRPAARAKPLPVRPVHVEPTLQESTIGDANGVPADNTPLVAIRVDTDPLTGTPESPAEEAVVLAADYADALHTVQVVDEPPQQEPSAVEPTVAQEDPAIEEEEEQAPPAAVRRTKSTTAGRTSAAESLAGKIAVEATAVAAQRGRTKTRQSARRTGSSRADALSSGSSATLSMGRPH